MSTHENLFRNEDTNPWFGTSNARFETEPTGDAGITGLAFLGGGGGGGVLLLNSDEDALDRSD